MLVGLAVLGAILVMRRALPGLHPVQGLALAVVVCGTIMVPVMVFTKLGKDMVGDIRYLISRRARKAAQGEGG